MVQSPREEESVDPGLHGCGSAPFPVCLESEFDIELAHTEAKSIARDFLFPPSLVSEEQIPPKMRYTSNT
jgi:hypothetical protein